MNETFYICGFRKALPLFSLSFLYYILCKTTTAKLLFGGENKSLLLGCTTIKGETCLSCSSLWFWMSYHLSKLLHSPPFFLPNLTTLWNIDSHYSLLRWTLNNGDPVCIGLSSPVIIQWCWRKRRQMFLPKLKTSFNSKVLTVSEHNVAIWLVPWQPPGLPKCFASLGQGSTGQDWVLN